LTTLLNKDLNIAIIGATGMVGRELIGILEQSTLKISSLKLYGSERSEGEFIEFREDKLTVERLTSALQIDSDIAFFAAGSGVSSKFVEKVAASGTICIDKSCAFRMRPDVPLIVPEVNGDLLKKGLATIIASPNCVAIPLTQVLAPLNKLSPILSVVVVTFQAVSGAGKSAQDELEGQVRDLFNMREINTDVFGKRIAFNVLPFIPAQSAIDDLGKTDEEVKVIEECKKILALPELLMDATCVRVPVFNGHSMAVHLAFKDPLEIPLVRDTLAKAPGVMLVDEPKKAKYPTPLDAAGQDVTLVGRVRVNTAVPCGLSLWITSDNLRTGAALNAVRIAETIIKE
jgi:aspartate-semialdehyde dehydrogenase